MFSFKRLKGYTLIYAIVAVLIITCVSLLFLSYFRINYAITDNVKSKSIARQYCYQGLEWLDENTVQYDSLYAFRFSDGIQLNLQKRRWGVYDLFVSVVVSGKNDTLFSKIALKGYQKDNEDNTSLYLRNTPSQLTISDSISVKGNCFIPGGVFKQSIKNDTTTLSKQQVFSSPDTLWSLPQADSMAQYVKAFDKKGNSKIEVDDSITNSFLNQPLLISADTVILSGKLRGNVIVHGNFIKLTSSAEAENILIIGKNVFLPDFFSGKLQIMATDTISIGKNCTLGYPSIIALMPAIDDDSVVAKSHHYLALGDSSTLFGEIYAYSSQYSVSLNMYTRIRKCTKLVGSVFTSGDLEWTGNCQGSIICDKIINYNKQAMQVNLLSNTSIDSLPEGYAYSALFPKHGHGKIVTWLQ